jgi:steroid 5-alpha reductase family enzyme
VSALAYVVYAIVALFGRTGAVDLQVAMSYLVIGVFLVMLSAAWRRIRARVMALVPGGWAERLPVSAAA